MVNDLECKFCSESVEINEDEEKSGTFICPSCGKSNEITGASSENVPLKKIVTCDYCDSESLLESVEVFENGFNCPQCSKKNSRLQENWVDSLKGVGNDSENLPIDDSQKLFFQFITSPGAWFDSFKSCSLLPIFILNSILGIFSFTSDKSSISAPFLVLIFGILYGNLTALIASVGFNITGKWIGGHNDFSTIFRALSLSRIPLLFAFFKSPINLVLVFYSISLLIVFLSKAQKFSYNKGFANIILTALTILFPMIIAGFLLKIFYH